mgnify:CR=1 FL=1
MKRKYIHVIIRSNLETLWIITVYYPDFLNGVTLQKIESILEKFEIMLTEIDIVDYNKAA